LLFYYTYAIIIHKYHKGKNKQMNHNQLNANGNYQQEPVPVNFAELTKSLLESEDVKGLPELEQGAFIMDHLLGRIVAAGPVESNAGQKSPLDLVRDMQDYAVMATHQGHEAARTLVTRKNGMRGMVDALSRDVRVGSLWLNLENRVTGGYGSDVIALSSIAMIDGYLDGKEEATTEVIGGGWKEALTDEVQAYAQGDEKPRWNADDLLGSDVEKIRKGQLAWKRSVEDAQRAGVDMNLVIRSADRLRTNHRAGQALGRRVASIMFTNPYDRMFDE
jgi:hypothetical protein